jgi:hypothetical protein
MTPKHGINSFSLNRRFHAGGGIRSYALPRRSRFLEHFCLALAGGAAVSILALAAYLIFH